MTEEALYPYARGDARLGRIYQTYRDHAELREAAVADDARDERADRWRRTAGLLPPAKR